MANQRYVRGAEAKRAMLDTRRLRRVNRQTLQDESGEWQTFEDWEETDLTRRGRRRGSTSTRLKPQTEA